MWEVVIGLLSVVGGMATIIVGVFAIIIIAWKAVMSLIDLLD